MKILAPLASIALALSLVTFGAIAHAQTSNTPSGSTNNNTNLNSSLYGSTSTVSSSTGTVGGTTGSSNTTGTQLNTSPGLPNTGSGGYAPLAYVWAIAGLVLVIAAVSIARWDRGQSQA